MPVPKVDTRQPPEMITPFVRAGWEAKALPHGDYEIYDSVGEVVLIEDKPIKKLLDDMTSGVLQRQIRSLCEATRFPILLIRGQWIQQDGYLLGLRYTWQQAWNQLQTLQDIGCRIQLATSTSHATQRIFELAEYYSKEYHGSVARQPAGDHFIAILCQIHGIDVIKAKLIKEKLRTLEYVACAKQEMFESIGGIGPKLAERIYKFWRT